MVEGPNPRPSRGRKKRIPRKRTSLGTLANKIFLETPTRGQHLKFLDLATLTPDPLPHSHEALCVAACCCHEILQSTFCQGHQHLEGSMEGAKKKLSDQYSQYHQYHPSSLLLYSDFIRSFRAHCFLLCFEEKVHIQGKTVDFSSIPCN